MPEEKRNPRIAVMLPPGDLEKLERYARIVKKDKQASVAAYLLQQKIEELDSDGKIPPPETLVMCQEELDQVIKFIYLLIGSSSRNGISFVLLGDLLGIDPGKLSDLHQMVDICRGEQIQKKR